MRTFLEVHAQSTYAPFLCEVLAARVAGGLFEVSQPVELAIELEGLYLESWPDSPAGPRVQMNLIRQLTEMGREDEARELLADFEERWPAWDEQAARRREALDRD